MKTHGPSSKAAHASVGAGGQEDPSLMTTSVTWASFSQRPHRARCWGAPVDKRDPLCLHGAGCPAWDTDMKHMTMQLFNDYCPRAQGIGANVHAGSQATLRKEATQVPTKQGHQTFFEGWCLWKKLKHQSGHCVKNQNFTARPWQASLWSCPQHHDPLKKAWYWRYSHNSSIGAIKHDGVVDALIL